MVKKMENVRSAGRPRASELLDYDVHAHLVRLQKIAGQIGEDVRPPTKTIKKIAFERWINNAAVRPSRSMFNTYINFLNEKFPLEQKNWGDYFEEDPTALEKYMNLNNSLQWKIKKISNLFQDDDGYEDERKVSLSGIYQIIRPYTANEQRYILETMEIFYDKGRLRVLMYSHNQRSPHFIYEGEAFCGGDYLFALIRRVHDTGFGHASRCINLFIPRSNRNHSEPCISGILLRGNRAVYFGRASIALPFIAIRAEIDIDGLMSQTSLQIDNHFRRSRPMLQSAHFSEYGDKFTDGVFLNHHLLIGEIDNKRKNIFEFSKNMFDNIYLRFPDHRCTYTLPPDEVYRCITDVKRSNIYEIWSDAVEKDFTDMRFVRLGG